MSAWRALDLSGFLGQVSYEPGHWVMRYSDGAALTILRYLAE